MPGELKSTACCPICNTPLAALIDTTYGYKDGYRPKISVIREYLHEKPKVGKRRKMCKRSFPEYEVATSERRELEK